MAPERPAPERTATAGRGQRGESLVETLVAITVVTVVGLATFAGLRVVVQATAEHKESGVAEALLRSGAEQLQDPQEAYRARAAPGCVGGPSYPVPGTVAVPAGYTLAVTGVAFWTDTLADNTATTASTDFGAACPGTDPGLQRITLTVTTPSGATESLDVVKRRD